MANLRDIRNRIESIQNTQQITRAMKMVAAAKLRKAQNRIEAARPYAVKMQEVVSRLAGTADEGYKLLEQRDEVNNILFIVVSSDRGLCGGFNNNLFKTVEQRIVDDFSDYHKDDNLSLLTIGRKGSKHYGKRNYQVTESFPGFFDSVEFGKTSDIIKSVISDFKSGTFDEVYLAFNEFKSVIAQNRIVEKVLPVEPDALDTGQKEEEEFIDYIYEPDAPSILKELLPLHVKIQLWRAILESNAAEQGARMTAMDSATDNAEELEEDLQLEYNRARQSAITTEISEIISGAQALSEA